tara:strand:+ start:49 stop:1833 length:1785 start_codon:yes stop_codon:yes gene_type:complete
MYLGHSPTNAGSFIFLDDIASGFNGSETQFTLQVGGVSITPNTQNLLIALDGIIQQAPDAYTTSGSTITFTGAVPSGTDFYGILMGQSASIGQGTIGADELKISGNGTSGQLVKSDGDGSYSYVNQSAVTADANVLSGTTLKSTVVNSSLTSVGTLTSLTTSGNIIINGSSTRQIEFKDGSDSEGAIVFDEITDGFIFKVGGTPSTGKTDALKIDNSGYTHITERLVHSGDTDTFLRFTDNQINFSAGNVTPLVLASTNQALFATGSASDPSISFSGDDDTGIYNGGVGAITFMNNGNRSLELQSSLVAEFSGIIRAKGTSNDDYGNTAFETRAGNNSQGLKISHGGGNGKLEIFGGGQSRTQFYANQITANINGLEIKTTDGQSLTLGTNNTTRVLIDGSTGDFNLSSQAFVLGTNASSTDRLLRIARFASNSTDLVIGELRYTGSSDGGHAFAGIKTYVHHTNGRGRLEFWVNDASTYAERMSLYYDGNLSIDGSLSSSDLTFKKNVKTISSALETVTNLRGVTYNWKVSTGKDTETKQYGMIAQEVEELLPELVKDYGDNKKKQLNYTAIIPVLVESIKELSAKVTALEGS